MKCPVYHLKEFKTMAAANKFIGFAESKGYIAFYNWNRRDKIYKTYYYSINTDKEL